MYVCGVSVVLCAYVCACVHACVYVCVPYVSACVCYVCVNLHCGPAGIAVIFPLDKCRDEFPTNIFYALQSRPPGSKIRHHGGQGGRLFTSLGPPVGL